MIAPAARAEGTDDSSPSPPAAYGAVFWWCYVANTALMVGVSLLFRYSDFVIRHLGGSEGQLGLIVGVGMIGAVVMRAVQGVAIDRWGARRMWLLSLALYVASLLLHLLIARADGPAIFAVRVLLQTSIAGAFGASLTYISLRAPPEKMAEMIGTLGSSGFVGLALGPVLGDLLFAKAEIGRADVVRMFVLAAALGCVSLAACALATRGVVARRASRTPPPWRLLGRYHPGWMLLAGAMMGIGLGLPNIFLAAYAQDLGLQRIQHFFVTYALVAFAMRMLTRRAVERWGVRRTIVAGFALLALSMGSFLLVRSSAMLAWPAVFGGAAHALLFPAVVAGGCRRFPERHRGLATTLMLAMFDLGNLVGQPLAGGVVESARLVGAPPYPTMFVLMTLALAATAAFFGVRGVRTASDARPRRAAVASRAIEGGSPRCST